MAVLLYGKLMIRTLKHFQVPQVIKIENCMHFYLKNNCEFRIYTRIDVYNVEDQSKLNVTSDTHTN